MTAVAQIISFYCLHPRLWIEIRWMWFSGFEFFYFTSRLCLHVLLFILFLFCLKKNHELAYILKVKSSRRFLNVGYNCSKFKLSNLFYNRPHGSALLLYILLIIHLPFSSNTESYPLIHVHNRELKAIGNSSWSHNLCHNLQPAERVISFFVFTLVWSWSLSQCWTSLQIFTSKTNNLFTR